MPDQPLIDTVLFDRNHRAFPQEELQSYWGMHVAWDATGTRILAAGQTLEEVIQKLRQLGIDPCSTVGDFIEDPHEL